VSHALHPKAAHTAQEMTRSATLPSNQTAAPALSFDSAVAGIAFVFVLRRIEGVPYDAEHFDT
jgi:hypothetical protein